MLELDDVRLEIADLENKLQQARALRDIIRSAYPASEDESYSSPRQNHLASVSSVHNILLLGDSALPLGSFAFSSGLESFLAHQPRSATLRSLEAFDRFLGLSLCSLASTTLPFVLAAHRGCLLLADLDNDLDASMTCCVARRASIAQGKALITLWDRSFQAQAKDIPDNRSADFSARARASIAQFVQTWKTSCQQPENEDKLHGHLAPLFGVLCAAMSISLEQTLYLYLLNHAKTLLSAAIRASVMGPYHAQRILAGTWLVCRIQEIIETEIRKPSAVEDAGQTVPMLDLWGGRHDIVYSRIFNS